MEYKSPNTNLSERELFHRLLEGDEWAFSQIFYLYKDKLYGFLFNIVKSQTQAEDLVQDVFVKIWLNRKQLSEVESIGSFVFKMAHNHAIDFLRKYSKESYNTFPHDLQHLFIADEADVFNDIVNDELRKRINEAILRLPPQQQKVYVLRKEQGYKHDEIAKELNLSVSTIRNHLMRAMTNLRKDLAAVYTGLMMLLILIVLFR